MPERTASDKRVTQDVPNGNKKKSMTSKCARFLRGEKLKRVTEKLEERGSLVVKSKH
jgi:hypothetical protein